MTHARQVIIEAASRFNTFTTFQRADEYLTNQGFLMAGQDGCLCHLYDHHDGRTAKVSGLLMGGYGIEIQKQKKEETHAR